MSHHTSSRLARSLRREGYSLDQWRVLDQVARRGELAMTAIAEAVLMPAPSLTRLVDRLVTVALVYRVDDPADRRRVLVRISTRGRSVHRQLAAVVAAVEAENFATLHPDQVELLQSLLSQLHDALTVGP